MNLSVENDGLARVSSHSTENRAAIRPWIKYNKVAMPFFKDAVKSIESYYIEIDKVLRK